MSQDYPYYKYVKSPSQIGMSAHGTLETMGKDVEGLISYVELLVTGSSKASATGQPMGNKYFLKTAGTCVDPSGQQQDRYVYINNVPAGNIPFISSGLDTDFTDFRGLIPGTLSNLNSFDPTRIMRGFTMGAMPECQELTMQTISTANEKGMGTHFVATADIADIDPCTFPNRHNQVTGQKCKEGFQQEYSSDDSLDIFWIVFALLAMVVLLVLWGPNCIKMVVVALEWVMIKTNINKTRK